jgi:hypothetical protein
MLLTSRQLLQAKALDIENRPWHHMSGGVLVSANDTPRAFF